jgi:hypothetical protein
MRRTLAVLLLLALAACGPDHGTITDLTYEPDASFWMPQTICSGSGTSTSCVTALQYYPIPECWHVWFELDGDKGDDCVTALDWRSLSIGQYFDERR